MNSKKNIYFILQSMSGGGAEKVAAILLNYLDRRKYNLKLVLFNKKGEYLEDSPLDIEIIDLNKKNRWDFFKLIIKLRKLIRENKPDTLLSFLHYTNIITVLSSLFLKNRPKIILSERSYHRSYLQYVRLKLLKRFLLNFAYKRADKIIVISKGIKNAIIEDFKIKEDKIVVIYNPINIKLVGELSEERIGHHFFAQNNKVIISIGRLTKQKNFSLLIRSFALVREKIPTYLIILGQGELKSELEALAKRLRVEKYIDFVGFKKNPFSWIKKANLFVLSSSWEGFGNVIIEAMACGTPVISTDCPSGPNEIITNRKNGILVPVDDISSMSKAILELAENEGLRNKIKEEAFKNIERFDVASIVPQYEGIFEEPNV